MGQVAKQPLTRVAGVAVCRLAPHGAGRWSPLQGARGTGRRRVSPGARRGMRRERDRESSWLVVCRSYADEKPFRSM